jgi:hypothetical protein
MKSSIGKFFAKLSDEEYSDDDLNMKLYDLSIIDIEWLEN